MGFDVGCHSGRGSDVFCGLFGSFSRLRRPSSDQTLDFSRKVSNLGLTWRPNAPSWRKHLCGSASLSLGLGSVLECGLIAQSIFHPSSTPVSVSDASLRESHRVGFVRQAGVLQVGIGVRDTLDIAGVTGHGSEVGAGVRPLLCQT